MEDTMQKTDIKTYTIQEVRHLTGDTYVLRFDRHGMNFKAGQHVLVGLFDDVEAREYSIYSGEKDDFLEILIKEVEDGIVSKKLKNLKPGDSVKVHGPSGFFMMNINPPLGRKFLFISSGTGISPFHSFIKTYPMAKYSVLHGIRHKEEEYEADHYAEGGYVSCVTQDSNGGFHGRVTDYLFENDVDPETMIYLCGNSNMILDAMDILNAKGIPHERMHTEVYF